ncbi:hypothetical protein Har1131_03710 [Haloarcula sp. CBA1131]|uniref:ATP-binding protein n=1 Tax=Haloarcula sp. CBA1131 TaxID=1853686 RepID=UPI001243E8DE|nr:ATP-binding protein [Haloarcula sp. CBA1131]KAA9405955.1 hypothetical protein Har1131_03710 [Haloarcula sp. CBA1131]
MANDTGVQPKGEIAKRAREVTQSSSEVNIDINFQIIEQFSAELYDNPRRAIEELVCNSYDAGASDCYISTPQDDSDRLLVLDNGESMDMEGIEWLWRVAESPKARDLGPDRTNHNRQQIGKFGVGKLAAFALGSRLTYIANKGDTTRIISVDQSQLEDRKVSDSPPFPVYEISTDKAREKFSDIFAKVPNPWEQNWDTWTLALVEDIQPENTGNQLMPWLLERMINSSIPISSNFEVYLNGEQISKSERDADPLVSIDVTDSDAIEEIEDGLKSYWKNNSSEYDSREDVPETKYRCQIEEFDLPNDTSKSIAGIHVPNLGPVIGSAEIYESKLDTKDQQERGFHDHGFKITVRGKLLNRHSPKWGIDEIGYKWWKQFTAELEIPGLDQTLLVQRDSTKRDRREPEIAKEVAHKLYNLSRRERDQLESESDSSDHSDYEPKSLTNRVGSKTPNQTYEAVSGLNNGKSPVEPEEVDIIQRTQSTSDYPVEFDDSAGNIVINEEHSLYKLLVEDQDIEPNLRETFGEVYASSLLLLGYLRFNLSEEDYGTIDQAEEFFDYALRSAADSFRPHVDYLKTEIETAVYEDDRSIIETVADAFQHIRFGNVNRSAGGEHRFIEIPLSSTNPEIKIQSIGDRGKVRIDDDLSILAPGERFDRTFCVAREYGKDSDELDQIRSASPDGVTFATTEAVKYIIECHYKRRFTYSQVVDILHYEGTPDSMISHIDDVWGQTPEQKLVLKVLKEAHRIQTQRENVTPSVGALTIADSLSEYNREDIENTVEALSTLTNRVRQSSQSDEFYLNSSPDDILQELGNTTGITGIENKNAQLSDY